MLLRCAALLRGASPSRGIAFQSPRTSGHGFARLCRRLATLCLALPSPCHASLCLRQALLIKATPSLPVSVHRRCMPRLCFAIAERYFALPSPLVAQRVCAVAIRSLSQLGCSTPLRIGPLPVLRGSVRFLAHPSPIAPMLCRRLGAELHCSSLAALDIAVPILRRSRLSRAFPSRRRAKQISSFAALGLAGLLRRRAARRHALLLRRLPEQIKALPLQRPSPQRHRDALPSHANPLPPTSSRCRRIALKASLRCSVAPPRYAAQIHRHTMPLIALPSRIIATLR